MERALLKERDPYAPARKLKRALAPRETPSDDCDFVWHLGLPRMHVTPLPGSDCTLPLERGR